MVRNGCRSSKAAKQGSQKTAPPVPPPSPVLKPIPQHSIPVKADVYTTFQALYSHGMHGQMRFNELAAALTAIDFSAVEGAASGSRVRFKHATLAGGRTLVIHRDDGSSDCKMRVNKTGDVAKDLKRYFGLSLAAFAIR